VSATAVLYVRRLDVMRAFYQECDRADKRTIAIARCVFSARLAAPTLPQRWERQDAERTQTAT
jgi:hypothetical protein